MCMTLAKNLEEAFNNAGSVEEELLLMKEATKEFYEKEELPMGVESAIFKWLFDLSSTLDVTFEDIEELATEINEIFDPVVVSVRQYG